MQIGSIVQLAAQERAARVEASLRGRRFQWKCVLNEGVGVCTTNKHRSQEDRATQAGRGSKSFKFNLKQEMRTLIIEIHQK